MRTRSACPATLPFAARPSPLAAVRATGPGVGVNGFGGAAVFAGAAGALGLAALVAFAMTLVIWLARLIGPLGGGAAAVAILGLGAFVLFNMARQRIEQKPSEQVMEDDDDDDDRG